MNLFEVLLINFVFIICPLTLFLFYVAYNKNINQNTNNLFFNIGLLTSFYLIFKFNIEKYSLVFFIISVIPLVIAYIKKDHLGIILLSFVEVLSLYNLFELNIYIIILELLLLFILSFVINKKYLYIVFIIMQSLLSLYILKDNVLDILIISFFAIIIFKFIILLMEYGEKILKYHMSLKELEREKQIRNSLFKISHEIKNPLAVCKGYFDMMDIDDENQIKRYVPIIKEELDHALMILKDFLSMTKIRVEKDDMDINMLVEEVVDSFKPILKNKKIDSKVELVDDDVYIEGDYNRLKQVLINILKNSVESIDKENGIITINTEIKNNNFEIVIKDNGMGMTPEVIKHLAEPFYTTKKNGTGLGVAFSKEILKEHGAKIEYYSDINIGTTTLIKFPIQKNAI